MQEIQNLGHNKHNILCFALTSYIDEYTKNISHLPADNTERICSESVIKHAIELRQMVYDGRVKVLKEVT